MIIEAGEKKSQIKFEETFIKALLDKLKIGNRRGIHLNAVPGSARSRLDLKDFDQIKEGKALEFLNSLFTQEEFKYDVSFNGIALSELGEDEKNALYLIARKLNNTTIDNEDQFLETGIRNFGFGYPLLVRRDNADPTKVIKAPLLIWNLDLTRSNRENNLWTISKTADHPVRINELLRSHILKDTQVSIDVLDEGLLSDNIIDEKELTKICQNILSQLNISTGKVSFTGLKLEKCPTAKAMDMLANDTAWIQWSGIFGIYTSRKESVIRQTEEILKKLAEFQNKELRLDNFQTSTISSVSTDPSKEEIINTLTSNEIKLIQGPPGTGKSQALTAIITNVVENGGRCLVVCEKRTALNVIQQNLDHIGLSDMSVVIDDVSKDRNAVVRKARSLVDGINIYSNGSSRLRPFNEKFKEFVRLRDEFNKKHINEREGKIQDESWKDSIGRFLQFTNDIDWNLIKKILPNNLQNIDHEPFSLLEAVIQDASTTYGRVPSVAGEVFSNLNTDFFKSPYNKKTADNLKDHLLKVKEDAVSFLRELDNKEEDLFSYKSVGVFEGEKVIIQRIQHEKDLEKLLILEELLKKLIAAVGNISKDAYTNNVLGGITNESLDELKLFKLKIEINDVLSFSRTALNQYRVLIDAYIELEKVSRNSEELVNSILETIKFTDLVNASEQEKARITILEDVLKTVEEIEEISKTDVFLAYKFADKLKTLLGGNQSKKKKKLRDSILNNITLISNIEIFTNIENSNLVKKGEEVCERIDSIKTDIETYRAIEKWFTAITQFELVFNKNIINIFPKLIIEVSKFKNIQDYKKALEERVSLVELALNNLSVYKNIHDWCYFFTRLEKDKKDIISKLIDNKVNPNNWLSSVRAWHYYGMLSSIEESSDGFNVDSESLDRLSKLYEELKKDQKEVIKSKWRSNMVAKIPYNFKIIYNLRKNKVHSRTNSLRKIIENDFNLFTAIFPVILTNPLAADSILPLELGIFDVVIFDEASQLRIEDTFTSLIRGKYKIIAGDMHQMPPSNYFQSSGDIQQDEDSEEDAMENTELALSESLLEYAEKLGFQSQSYLDYHYRSQHPALIDFSNVAFYGGNLVPFPERFSYQPIKFYDVNGEFVGRVNEKEVDKVISVLRQEIEEKEGKCPSVGIATFNLPQRNRIIDRINEECLLDEKFASKIEKIKESKNGFFIKNLENIQGDEMDVMIISTTYGKDEKGKFFERFGPLNLDKGYKLLNVLITRAREKVFICCSVPSIKYFNYDNLLEEYGNNKKAIFYAYLAYARALSEERLEDANSVKEKLIEYSHDRPRIYENLTESPFEEEVYECLLEKFNESEIESQKKIGGFRVDFLINVGDSRIILECDGKAYHSTNEAYAHDVFRQKELEGMGYKVYRIWSTNWWHDHTGEINKLLQYLDNQR